MRIKTILLSILLLMIPFAAFADEAFELKKKILFDQKKLVVMENMEFSEEEGKAFWPVYNKYQEELFKVTQRAGRLIVAYAASYQTLSDDQALKVIDEYYEIQEERIDVMKKMAASVKKVLPGKRAFRYMQVETKLQTIARYELSKEIPLAR